MCEILFSIKYCKNFYELDILLSKNKWDENRIIYKNKYIYKYNKCLI